VRRSYPQYGRLVLSLSGGSKRSDKKTVLVLSTRRSGRRRGAGGDRVRILLGGVGKLEGNEADRHRRLMGRTR